MEPARVRIKDKTPQLIELDFSHERHSCEECHN
jgi:hypothetical protein